MPMNPARSNPLFRLGKIVLALLLAGALVAAGVRIVRHKKQELAKAKPPTTLPLAVRTVTVAPGKLAVTHRYQATLQAGRTARLAPRITARIIEIRGREGSTVQAGDLLVRLDDRALQARVQALAAQMEAARANLLLAEKVWRRDQTLFDHQALSKEAFDRSTAALATARAKVAELENLLAGARIEAEYSKLTAPFAGRITARLQEPGELALPGQPILIVDSKEHGYKLVIQVPQSVFPNLRPGGKVAIFPPLATTSAGHNTPPASSSATPGDAPLQATISRLYPADAAASTGPAVSLPVAEVDLPRPPFGLPTGATLQVALTINEVKGLLLPERALLSQAGRVLSSSANDLVFVVDEKSRVRPVPVNVVTRANGQICIKKTASLQPGMRVVVAGEDILLRLHAGQEVRPVAQDQGGQEAVTVKNAPVRKEG